VEGGALSLEIITKRINVPELKARKKGRPIVALTAYTTLWFQFIQSAAEILGFLNNGECSPRI
jgi:hypothetical protein